MYATYHGTQHPLPTVFLHSHSGFRQMGRSTDGGDEALRLEGKGESRWPSGTEWGLLTVTRVGHR
jgi:hypothetical protein